MGRGPGTVSQSEATGSANVQKSNPCARGIEGEGHAARWCGPPGGAARAAERQCHSTPTANPKQAMKSMKVGEVGNNFARGAPEEKEPRCAHHT